MRSLDWGSDMNCPGQLDPTMVWNWIFLAGAVPGIGRVKLLSVVRWCEGSHRRGTQTLLEVGLVRLRTPVVRSVSGGYAGNVEPSQAGMGAHS